MSWPIWNKINHSKIINTIVFTCCDFGRLINGFRKGLGLIIKNVTAYLISIINFYVKISFSSSKENNIQSQTILFE